MSDARTHYETLLAQHYSWMFGDFDARVATQRALFEQLGLKAAGSASAVDLGCGSGFQAVALAQLGYRVTGVDFSPTLLAELERRRGAWPIRCVEGDLLEVKRWAEPGTDLVVCMGDTLPHLESKAAVEQLLRDTAGQLRPGGHVVLTFRDLSREATGLDRFIPVRADDEATMICALEFGPDTVTVTDLIHRRQPDGRWQFGKSSYRKLRLDAGTVMRWLEQAGLTLTHRDEQRGLVTLAARR